MRAARARRHLLTDQDGTREVWPAFTDVMSTLALILFVLVLLAYVRSLVAAKQLDALGHQIALSEQRLRAMNAELARSSAEVAAGRAALKDEEAVVAERTRELGDVRGQLQAIAVLRVSVLDKLKQAIEAELGPKNTAGAPLVTIGDNGDLMINESLVFESASYAVKPEAKPLLDGLSKALANLLADPAVRDNIDAILIQGHTDERGTPEFNWDLSAKRATAVVDYLFHANKVLADSYGRYFAASAYSKYRPVTSASTPAAYQQNRRIEISVIPKDANVRKVIDDYVQSTAAPIPTPAPPPAPAPSPTPAPSP